MTGFPKESTRQGGLDASAGIVVLSEEDDLEDGGLDNDAMEED